MNRTNVGIIGCGVISRTYAGDIGRFFPKLRITACADLETTLAEKLAAEFGIPKACTTAELLSDPEIGLVINLTPPQAHTELNRKIIEAGKHLFCEKPFAQTPEEAQELLDLADRMGVQAGSAPDTFLASGLQSVRYYLDAGMIGKPFFITANMTTFGVETWHPNPRPFYAAGSGPLYSLSDHHRRAYARNRVPGHLHLPAVGRPAGAGDRRRVPDKQSEHEGGLSMLEIRTKRGKVLLQLLLILMTVPYIVPLIQMVAGSLGGRGFENYKAVWDTGVVPIFFRNSAIISAGVILLVYLFSMTAGFGFSKMRFFGKEVFFWLILVALTLPEVILLTPLFVTFQRLRMYNTFFAVILPQTALQMPFTILLTRNFLNGVPDELMEAARIDGANTWQSFWSIVLRERLPMTRRRFWPPR